MQRPLGPKQRWGLSASSTTPSQWSSAAGLLLALTTTCINAVAGDGVFQSIQGSALQSNFTTQAITIASALSSCQSGAPPISLVEVTISKVQTAFLDDKLNCTQLIQSYIQRIQSFDRPSGVNSIRVLNPSLEQQAAELDDLLQKVKSGEGRLPKLFCVPLLVKDNYDTLGMSASNGAAGLLDNFPAKDAHQIRLLKDAGAIIVGKTNMAEWAFSPDFSIGSAFGVVRNPYATDYSTAGSSGGTAAAIAANFALVGLGTDTGNSIRGPAGWNSLVGIRPSLGLSSRAGIIPLDSTSDMAGPLARTVEDTVRVFEATVGQDPADNLTSLQSRATIPSNYTQFLRADGLKGMKVGVMRQVINLSSADAAVMSLFEQALADLQSSGASLVENFTIVGNSLGARDWRGSTTWFTGYGDGLKEEQLDCGARFKVDVNAYLSAAGSRFKSVQAVVAEGEFHPSANASMTVRLGIPYVPSQYPLAQMKAQGYLCNCEDFYANPCRLEFRKRLVQSMDEAGVSVLVTPTWSNPPLLIGDYGRADGNNSPQISPPTGAPAMVVPMGFTSGGAPGPLLPASLQFLARPFDEGTLITAAYSYEQATRQRRYPPAFPECQEPMAPSAAPAMGASLGSTAQQYTYNSLG